ncbi:MAG TPA: hypothetical protein VFV34_29670 [Blastocatellia bacterium]|nr:hypothetical protein [Blastocatellia bacterium]
MSQLVSEGVVLTNALELVDWNEDPTQFLICEACGSVHCKQGDWVSVRRAGLMLLFLPAFDELYDGPSRSIEYGPPLYIRKRGIAEMKVETYESLRNDSSSFPAFQQIRLLTMKEAILSFQWEAPLEALGRLPGPCRFREELFLAASEGDLSDQIGAIERFVAENLNKEEPVELRKISDSDHAISLYLDNRECWEWRPLLYEVNEVRLVINSEYAIVPTTAGIL